LPSEIEKLWCFEEKKEGGGLVQMKERKEYSSNN